MTTPVMYFAWLSIFGLFLSAHLFIHRHYHRQIHADTLAFERQWHRLEQSRDSR